MSNTESKTASAAVKDILLSNPRNRCSQATALSGIGL